MTQKTYQTAVVLIPPEAVWLPIQALRQQYDRHIQRWMPHITLLYPFRPHAEFERMVGALAPVCARLRPFAVHLATVHTFRHGRDSYTLWLAPEPKDALTELHTQLWHLAPECDDVRRFGPGFTPHLSIGQGRGHEHVHRLVAQVQARWRPLTFVASEISLIWRHEPPDDIFRVAHRIRLGQE
ncbi:MAG TPA: 2'-5' RNA ligase family protein [Candidatus Tectomicrobia bacterium]